ncbi:MAG: FAD-dependent oxidoreductase [Clostridiales bacterium]|nr:FAD-dependent oxidoreductase [Clostridiales bacterium]
MMKVVKAMELTEHLKTEVKAEFDVAVAGGGIAGISAALAAARQGAKVLLVESSYILGGLATSGLVTIYLPLCDGMGRQVSFGICEELIRMSAKHELEGYRCEEWFSDSPREKRMNHRFETQYNAQFFAMEAERLLLKEGVTILYGTMLCRTKMEDNKLTHIIVENKSGRQAIRVSAAVDATGDADIFWYSGLKTAEFAAKNVLACWYYFSGENGAKLNMLGYSEDPESDNNKALIERRFSGLDAWDNSEMVQLSHEQMLIDAGKNGRIPVTMPTIPQLRMTRRLVGEYELDSTEEHKHFDTSIGMISNWKKRGPVYEVPFETLYTKECPNIFAAGRCISVTDLMWDISRVIPCCAVTGEAAGIAAAMMTKAQQVDVALLQEKLRLNGVILHEDMLEKQ